MKKIFLILSLFFIFCLSIFAREKDFYDYYPKGLIKIEVIWKNDKTYSNLSFYNDNKELSSNKKFGKLSNINHYSELISTLKKEEQNRLTTLKINHFINGYQAKCYNNKNILIRELIVNKNKIYIKIYDNSGNLKYEVDNNIKTRKYSRKAFNVNGKLIGEIFISFGNNKSEINLKLYNGNSLHKEFIRESSYVVKGLSENNIEDIIELFDTNHKNIISGYDKFYNDFGFLILEKTYKNGMIANIKEYNSYDLLKSKK